MSATQERIKKHCEAKKILEDLCNSPSNVLIVHYSCESFDDVTEGKTPRITSIALRYLKNTQTKSFSIHLVAEQNKILLDQIESKYDKLEKQMLDQFYEFVKEHTNDRWVHWNMRDVKFGFEAIEQRYRVLGGTPVSLNDDKKIDLAKILIDKYTDQYIGHPRLTKLLEKNSISMRNVLPGREEAIAVKEKKYFEIHQSTLSKVDKFIQILNKTVENNLKTNVNLIKIYGITPQGIYEFLKDNWIGALIFFVMGVILTKIIEWFI
jgi:hypothetical protein